MYVRVYMCLSVCMYVVMYGCMCVRGCTRESPSKQAAMMRTLKWLSVDVDPAMPTEGRAREGCRGRKGRIRVERRRWEERGKGQRREGEGEKR